MALRGRAAVGDKIRARTNSVGLPAAATASSTAAKGAVPSKLSKSTTSGSLEPVTQDDLKQLKAELLAEFRQELNQLKKELLQGTLLRTPSSPAELLRAAMETTHTF